MKNYWKFPSLENLYFEDSFVLEINSDPTKVEFLVETVLKENHPNYSPPKPREQYCYKNLNLLFSDAKEIIWIERSKNFYTDANNEIDYGNIDVFYQKQNYFYLYGDWGEVKIFDSSLSLKYLQN